MNRYQELYERTEKSGEGIFVPFVVLGDPSIEASERIIQTLIESGADALELGIPFSDPLADGPTIQRAMTRALKAGVTPDECFDLLSRIRESHPSIPIGLLVYANLVVCAGLSEFYARCHTVGVDSVLVADVPVLECQPFRKAALKHGVQPVLLCPPNSDDETMQKISELGGGYTYLLSRPGVTGTQVAAGRPVDHLLKQLIEFGGPPPLLGFGISQPEHVRESLKAGAKGVISGSAVIEKMESAASGGSLDDLAAFIRDMKEATRS